MKRFAPLSTPVMVFSLFLVFAIWLTPALANTPPVFTSLGQLRAEGLLGSPGAMDLDDNGNLYVADAMSRKILCFDKYGNFKRAYSDAAFKFADNRGLTSGRGLAVSPDGSRLYFSRDTQTLILDVNTGEVVGELDGSEIPGLPEFKLTGEIDLDAAGRVFVADAGPGRMTIKIYSADGQFLNKFGGVGIGSDVGKFQSISAMTINGAGKVVVADPNPADLGGKIQVFTLDPTTLAVAGVVAYAKNAVANFGTVEMHTPKGITFDELGRGYFMEYMFSTITVVNSSFTYLSKFNNPGYLTGQLAFVADALYDRVNKRLFVSCDGGRIEIFGVDGGNNPVYVNAPPTVPAVQSPTNGIIVLTATPTLVYGAASDDMDTATLTYQVVVKQGDTTVHTFTPTTATSVTVPAGILADDVVYSWMVQAVDSKGAVSGFSGGATFVVDTNDPPSVPVILAPVNGGVLATDSPEAVQTLAFAAATDDADTSLDYQVKILQGGTEVYATTTKATSVELTGDNKLVDNANYSWMVQAVDSKGAASGFSPAAAFVVNVNDPPTVPTLQSPVGSSVVESDAPVLTYVAATDDNDTTLTYQVVIKQGGAEVYAAATNETSLVVPSGTLTENAAYNWAVQAVDSKGLPSGFSPAASFVFNTVDEAPTAPVLTSTLGEGDVARDRQFAWTASTDPDPNDNVKLYTVELATDAEFADVVDSVQTEGFSLVLSDFAAYPTLAVSASYFCRVTALDQDETPSEPSAAVEFVYDTTVLTVDAGVKGSAVYLGGNLAYPGRPVGVTPLELRDLTLGTYVVAVEAPGFETYLETVSFDGSGAVNVIAGLQPAKQPTAFKGAKAINGKPGLKLGAAAAPFVIDFDGDGALDLLAGDASGSVNLYKSIEVSTKGEMTVGPAEVVPGLATQVLPGAVPFVADWNNDGRNDLLIGLGDGTVKLFLGGGADSLVQAGDVPLAVGAGAAPAVVDLDNDGRKDLVVGNALGEVYVCWNRNGTDAAPKLAAPVMLFTVGAPAVPTSIDWNADGVRELMVASAKGIVVYSNEEGAFVSTSVLATPAKAAFAVDADADKGEDLIIGTEDGRLLYAAASSFLYPASYPLALSAKVDEVEGLMVEADEASAELVAVVATIRGQIEAGSYAGAAGKAAELAVALLDADAKAAAGELAALCVADGAVDETAAPADPGTKPGKSAK